MLKLTKSKSFSKQKYLEKKKKQFPPYEPATFYCRWCRYDYPIRTREERYGHGFGWKRLCQVCTQCSHDEKPKYKWKRFRDEIGFKYANLYKTQEEFYIN